MSNLKRHQSGSVAEVPFELKAKASHQVVGVDRRKEARTETGAGPQADSENRDQTVVGRLGEQLEEVATNIMIYEYFMYCKRHTCKTTISESILSS